MKIRVTKASGAQVELSDVAGVEIVHSGPVSVGRFEPWISNHGPSFNLQLFGAGDGLALRDTNIQWPHPEVPIG
jgi:hypothetical protein